MALVDLEEMEAKGEALVKIEEKEEDPTKKEIIKITENH
jgi:hypothetical protein